MKTFVVEAVLRAPVESVFRACWLDPDFYRRQLSGASPKDADVSAWFPQGQEFRRVCFYTLQYGPGGTRCLETQKYRREERDASFVIHCAIVPEAAAGQALRIECEWVLRAGKEEGSTEVVVRGEVECGGGRVWGASALVEAALVAPARSAAQQLLDAAHTVLAAAPRPPEVVQPPPRASVRWSEYRHSPAASASALLGCSLLASLAASPAPPLVAACSPSSLCPAALPALLALSGTAPRDSLGRSALHAAASTCPPEREALRLAALRSLLAAGADVAAIDSEGNTPLHEAAASCSSVVVAALLACGAGREARNRAGRTPLELAQDAPPGPARSHSLELLGRSPGAE